MTVSFRQPLPLLDNDVLRTFVAIAETGNFSTAAEAVFRTPSAVSMQIKKLEEQLGAMLFIRDARSVSLTGHGEILLTYARRILALSNEVVARFIMPELSGVVRVGAPEGLGERLLPSVLKAFASHYPAVMIDVTIDTSSGLRRRMNEQRLDLALFNSTCGVPDRYEGQVVFTEKLVWAGAKCGTAHMRDPLPLSIWEEGCAWRGEALSRLEAAGRHYRVAYLSGHTMAQHAAITADLAIAPLPRSLVRPDMAILGEKEGLPELGGFDIRLVTAERQTGPIRAVADCIRDAFVEIAPVMA